MRIRMSQPSSIAVLSEDWLSTRRRADIAAGSLGRNFNTDRCLKYLGQVIFEGPIVVSVEIVDERASERVTSAWQCWGPDQNAILTCAHRRFMRTLGIGLCGGYGIGKRLIRLEETSVIGPVAIPRREHPFRRCDYGSSRKDLRG